MNGKSYLVGLTKQFQYYRHLAEEAIGRVDEGKFFYRPDEVSNSVAIIVNHLAGNMLSRWTGFLHEDGEKTWRHRDQEFIVHDVTKADIMNRWSTAWDVVDTEIKALKPSDLGKQVVIRHQKHSVPDALNRQIGHLAYHVGQIVFLVKHIRDKDWESLSIPLGESERFNKTHFKGPVKSGHYTDPFLKGR